MKPTLLPDTSQDILVKISECNAKLDSKRVEIEQLLARRAGVAAEFEATVPDTEMFKELLAKIFNRWAVTCHCWQEKKE